MVPIIFTAYTELIAEQGPKPRKVLADGRDLVKEKTSETSPHPVMIVGQQTAESGELGKQAEFRSWGLTPTLWAQPRWTGNALDATKPPTVTWRPSMLMHEELGIWLQCLIRAQNYFKPNYIL